jgi:hypothetical protein
MYYTKEITINIEQNKTKNKLLMAADFENINSFNNNKKEHTLSIKTWDKRW